MLNLFKKKTVQKVVDSVKIAFTDEATIIANIHNDFDSASERLLCEAKSIIENSKEDLIAKGERLKSLGFNSSKAAVESEKEINKRQENKELAEHIVYYNQWYPFNKFITEKEVKKICEKYHLVFGDANNYKGDIPEKNIKEIEAFVLREEDMLTRSNYDDYRTGLMAQSIGNIGLGLMGISDALRQRPRYELPTEYRERKVKPAFRMCAPEKDFDMTYFKTDGYKIVPKDPIVLQPVKGGYLIVTKWGLEASDELVVNEINN